MFITLEGIDGSGKTTLMDEIQAWLENENQKFLCTSEPCLSLNIGRMANTLLHDARINDATKIHLLEVARREHCGEIIGPAMAENYHVICDRYADSTYAYQEHETTPPIVPGLTLLLVGDPIVALSRVAYRDGIIFNSIDAGIMKRRQNRYLELASKYPERIKVIGFDDQWPAVKDILTNALEL